MESQNPLPPALQRVEKYFSQGFNAAISLDRDEKDGYRLIIAPEIPNKIFSSQSEAYNLLPSGSRWTPALGWHSYIGLPFPIQKPKWVLLGAEEIVKHPTRGAFPLVKGYIFQFPFNESVLRKLGEFASGLDLDGQKDIQGDIEQGLLQADSLNQRAHIPYEKKIIHKALTFYEHKVPFMFRTLILSESQFKDNKYPSYLMATVPAIKKSFSWTTRLQLI